MRGIGGWGVGGLAVAFAFVFHRRARLLVARPSGPSANPKPAGSAATARGAAEATGEGEAGGTRGGRAGSGVRSAKRWREAAGGERRGDRAHGAREQGRSDAVSSPAKPRWHARVACTGREHPRAATAGRHAPQRGPDRHGERKQAEQTKERDAGARRMRGRAAFASRTA